MSKAIEDPAAQIPVSGAQTAIAAPKKKQPYPFWLGGTCVCLSGVLLDGTNGE